MTRSNQLLVLLLMPFSATTAQSGSPEPVGFHATFAASRGDVIELDSQTGVLRTPRAQASGLRDCSDKTQVCLTDRHGFAFAYFRKCDDAGLGDYKRLRFVPKIVSVLHNSDVWMVFDAAPKYLFHYAYSKGIAGIYLGRAPSLDFRSTFHDRNFQLASLDAMEYRISGSETVAACSD